MEPTQDFSELVERLIHTKNYRELDLSFIERLVSNAAKASSDEKEILKSVKHAIHLIVFLISGKSSSRRSGAASPESLAGSSCTDVSPSGSASDSTPA